MSACYSNPQSRFAPLRGAWRADDESTRPTAAYWNLSCPLEWSKYSCVLQGATEHALESQALTFEPTGCSLPLQLTELDVLLGRRVVFSGDSLLRQVFIALGCLLFAQGRVQRLVLPWQPCTAGATQRHPATRNGACSGTRPGCIACGPHSGFETATVELLGGGSLHFAQLLRELRPPRPSDVFVVETGVHVLRTPL